MKFQKASKKEKLPVLLLLYKEENHSENTYKHISKLKPVNGISFEGDQQVFYYKLDTANKEAFQIAEMCRAAGAWFYHQLKENQIEEAEFVNLTSTKMDEEVLEGFVLSSYSFDKYFSQKPTYQFKTLILKQYDQLNSYLTELDTLKTAVFETRTLVNEPQNFLNAVQLSKEIQRLSKISGFSCEVFDKKKIEQLEMNGILAVNQGSVTPPTFSILEWKPQKARNKKPIVLVGKGVVYDTGGLSLKPTANSMDLMKCDMAGAAAVIGAIHAIALNKINIHIVGLIPATDNRPGLNAYTPGDVITMYNKKTVEVLNTDAEGRMLLADALSYASKYKPELVIDLATLTGSALAAIGSEAAVCMGTAENNIFDKLNNSGNAVYERLVRFPLWDEYAKHIKSAVADMKNIGGPTAGAITAGKFLQNFVEYPWVHIDIAGPAFIGSADAYRPKGGTAFGVRLLYNFLKNY